jgi:hypothetical protein
MATSPIPPMLIELQLETAKIQGQMQALQDNFANLGKTVEKQSSFFERFKATASGVFAGNLLTSGLMAFKNAIAGAVQDAQVYEQTLAKTNAVIASTGAVAGISADGLKQQASALESLSAIDENVILNGENVIATFTQIRNVAGAGNDIFNQTTKAALDLSVALGQDMQSSAIQLGKALNDPIKGVSALQRVGVTFDAQQKKMIKTMVEAGDTLGAQKVILAEVNREFGGAAKAAGDTFAGAVFRAKDKVQDFMRNAIMAIEPVLLKMGKAIAAVLDQLKPLVNFIAKNKDAFLVFIGVIGTAFTIFKAYQGILKLITIAQAAYNAVLAANPITLFVVALAALAAAFVYAWNKFKPFRDGVVEGLKFIVKGVGYLVGAIGSMLNILTKIPGVGSKFKGVADAVNDAAKSVGDFAAGLDKLKDKKISIGIGGTKSGADLLAGAKAGLAPTTVTADQLKAAEKADKQRQKDIKSANDDVTKLYEKMNKAIEEGNKKATEATKAYEKSVADTRAKYADKAVQIAEKRDAELAANEKKWNEAYKKAYAANEAEVTKIKEKYEKEQTAITEKYVTAQAQAHYDANLKIVEAQKKAAEDQANIVQKSIDRLRSAFASGTSASITEIFKSGADSADKMLEQLRSKLTAAKDLQNNAAKLAAAGYSQVFIEDVVKNGPEVGNQMASALLAASDDTKKQLQDLYAQVDTISNHGVDQLAKTMNQGGKLATDELMAAYNEVPKDLAITMQQINADLTKELGRAQGEYMQSLADAAATRDAAIADSKSKLDDALQAADEALAAANTQTMNDFNDALAKNAADLADALAQIQKDYEDKIAQIAEDTKAKLADLQNQLQAVIATLQALGQAQAAASAAASSPASSYIAPSAISSLTNPLATYVSGSDKKDGLTVNNNYHVPQTFVATDVNPTAVLQATMNGIKYSSAITVDTSTLAGIAAASARGTTSVAPSIFSRSAKLDE